MKPEDHTPGNARGGQLARWGLKALSQAIKQSFVHPRFHRELFARSVLKLWPEAAGTAAAQVSRAVSFHNGILWVAVPSAAWMQELSFLLHDLRKKLNKRLPHPAVNSIRLKIDPGALANAEAPGSEDLPESLPAAAGRAELPEKIEAALAGVQDHALRSALRDLAERALAKRKP